MAGAVSFFGASLVSLAACEKCNGLDHTPLYKFLLSKVGQDWDDIYSEAVAWLDKDEPIFRLVALQPEDGERYMRTG